MNRLIRTIILSLGVGAVAISGTTSAFADGWRRYDMPRERHHGIRGGDAAALGVLGLATGLIVGSSIANSRAQQPVYEPYPVDPYREPPRQRPRVYTEGEYGYYPQPPVRRNVPTYQVGGTIEPWSPEWADYCRSRYRSFDPSSGTFVGYDGNRRFCTTN